METLRKAAGIKSVVPPPELSTSSSEIESAKGETFGYMEVLNEQIRLLQEGCEELEKERDRLIAQNESISTTAQRTFAAYKSQIESLREFLRDNHIPDPTVGK